MKSHEGHGRIIKIYRVKLFSAFAGNFLRLNELPEIRPIAVYPQEARSVNNYLLSCTTKPIPCFWRRTRFSWAEISTSFCLQAESGPPDYSFNASAISRGIFRNRFPAPRNISPACMWIRDLETCGYGARRVIISGESATFRKHAPTDIR